jgi:hypothetical protein
MYRGSASDSTDAFLTRRSKVSGLVGMKSCAVIRDACVREMEKISA